MIKFDKIKIVTSTDYISDIDNKSFVINTKDGEVLYYKYHQENPYYLLIMADYSKNELIIEFTGKILLSDYPQLINKETIMSCFDNINNLNICKLRVDSIIDDSSVLKCDVTKDISEADIKSITSTIRQNLSNYTKWNIKRYNSGVVIENVVSTPKYKKRLVIYDKGKELNKASNSNFLNSTKNSHEVIDYYKDKVRFELNLNTMYQIRQLLNLPNNKLNSVLKSTANPILTIIDEAVKYEPLQQKSQTLRDYEHELLLRDCNFDLVKVEAKIRALSSKNTSIKRLMKPYKELYKRLQNCKTPSIDIRALVS